MIIKKLYRKIKKIKKLISKIFWFCLLTHFKILNKLLRKKENQIIFISNPDFSDNGRALYNEMIKNNLNDKYNIIWIVGKKNYKKYKQIIKHAVVRKNKSIMSLISYIRSKYVFVTHFQYLLNSKKQVRVQLWHGKSLKKTGNLLANHNKGYFEPNFLILSGELLRESAALAAGINECQVIITGLPRNDEMFEKVNLNYAFNITNKYRKIFLWMPTFRVSKFGISDGIDTKYGLPLINEGNLEELNNKLRENNCLMMIKMHRSSITQKKIKNLSNVRLINNSDFYEDFTLYNLIGNVDALITDYSSVFVDFLLKDKPLGFAYDDLEEYISSRGFVVDNPKDYMPGEHITTIEMMYSFISDVANDVDKYKEDRKKVNPLLNKYTDNQSALRVLKALRFIE